MRTPFCWLFPASLAGIVLSAFWGISENLLLIVAAGAGMAAVTAFKRSAHFPAFIFLSVGISLLLAARFATAENSFRKIASTPLPGGTYVTAEGRLLDFPRIHREYSLIRLRAQRVEYLKRTESGPVNFRIKVRGDLRKYFRGQRVRVSFKIYPQRPLARHERSGLGGYWLAKGIHFSGYCKSAKMVFAAGRAPALWKSMGIWRNRLRRALEKGFLQNPRKHGARGSLFEAMVLGDRGRLTPDLRFRLKKAGVFHLFAISGTHVTVLGVLVFLILKLLGCRRNVRLLGVALMMLFYLFFSGAPVSAVRAVLTGLLLILGRLLDYRSSLFNLLGAAGFLMLCLNPAAWLDAGFVLTFVLAGAVIAGRDMFVLSENPDHSQLVRRGLQFAGVCVGAAAVSMPLCFFYFNLYSPAGLIAGALLIPVTALIIAAGIGILLLSVFSVPLAAQAVKLVAFLPDLFIETVNLFSKTIDVALLRGAPPLYGVIAVVGLYFFLWRFRHFRKIRFLLGTALLVSLLAAAWPCAPRRPLQAEVYFIDVGQGDCACVVLPGGDALLVDGGGSATGDFAVGRRMVLPFLLNRGIRVRWIAVSHFHPDHVQGIMEIARDLQPAAIWVSAVLRRDRNWEILTGPKNRIPLRSLKAGDSVSKGKCRITCVFPPRKVFAEKAKNSQSQVLLLETPGINVVFTGDIETEQEKSLSIPVRDPLLPLVLKVAHHGSATSSSAGFLSRLSPALAVISCGAGNHFGFPHHRVLADFDRQKVPWISTAWAGSIRIGCPGARPKIEFFRGDPGSAGDLAF